MARTSIPYHANPGQATFGAEGFFHPIGITDKNHEPSDTVDSSGDLSFILEHIMNK
jgi:hypothetical protein